METYSWDMQILKGQIDLLDNCDKECKQSVAQVREILSPHNAEGKESIEISNCDNSSQIDRVTHFRCNRLQIRTCWVAIK